MSIVYCDICDRRVDTDEEQDGSRDIEAGVYSCSRCQAKWERQFGYRSFQDVNACGPEDVSGFDC